MERKFNLLILKYILLKKDWEFHITDDGEVTFILGNQEPSTVDMTDEQVVELLDAVIRW